MRDGKLARGENDVPAHQSVVLAKAGTQFFKQQLDSGLRRNDEV